MGAERAHALLSASSAHRWLTCTPSAQIESNYPDTESGYAREGTLAHKFVELGLSLALDLGDTAKLTKQLGQLRKDERYTQEMESCAQEFIKGITFRIDKLKRAKAQYVVYVEKRLDFGAWVPGGFGTADVVIIWDKGVEIIDYKYGKGVAVSAEDNQQLKLYALGAVDMLLDLPFVIEQDVKILMTIEQPRLGATSTARNTETEIVFWGNYYVKPRAILADKGQGEFCPSEDACRFCKAAAECRARKDINMALFDENPDPDKLTIEEIGELLKRAADIRAWLTSMEAFVEKSLLAGTAVPGWKLVEGKSNRAYTDPEKVAGLLYELGYEDSEIYDKKLRSFPQLEKLIGKQLANDMIGGLVYKPPGKPTVAAETDKREAIQPRDEILAAFDN